MARMLHFPENPPLHSPVKNGIIQLPCRSFSPPPCGEGPHVLGSKAATPESSLGAGHPKAIETAPSAPADFTRLLLDPLANFTHQYLALERMQNEETEQATRVLVQLRCHEYRSLWSRQTRDEVASMLNQYERLVEEVRTGRELGMGGINAANGETMDVRRELVLGIRKAVRDGVRMARHSGPGAG